MVALPTIDAIIERLRHNNGVFGDEFPAYGNGTNAYHLTPNQNWLAAFWAGLLWLVAAETQDPADVQRARALLPSFAARLDDQIRLNHDLGFLFTLSARAQWQLTGDEAARDLALRAADVLLARFRPAGGFIQAWDSKPDHDQRGRIIIDTMMNLPLLFWAGRETGEAKYTDAALAHAHTSRTFLLRDDGSTYHTYYFDPETGDPLRPATHQGYADHSIWARGQGWAIYGFTLAAEWTGDDVFLAAAQAATTLYASAMPPDAITPYDFRLPDDTPPHPDSSADAIAAGGWLRLADLTGDAAHRERAEARLQVLAAHAYDTHENAQGLLQHGTQHAPHSYGVDTYTIFGDYFFLEALMRLKDKAPDFWGPDAR